MQQQTAILEAVEGLPALVARAFSSEQERNTAAKAAWEKRIAFERGVLSQQREVLGALEEEKSRHVQAMDLTIAKMKETIRGTTKSLVSHQEAFHLVFGNDCQESRGALHAECQRNSSIASATCLYLLKEAKAGQDAREESATMKTLATQMQEQLAFLQRANKAVDKDNALANLEKERLMTENAALRDCIKNLTNLWNDETKERTEKEILHGFKNAVEAGQTISEYYARLNETMEKENEELAKIKWAKGFTTLTAPKRKAPRSEF